MIELAGRMVGERADGDVSSDIQIERHDKHYQGP